MSWIVDWAKERWLPTGKLDWSLKTVQRVATLIHLLAYLAIPFYQIERKLRLKYKRKGNVRTETRANLEMKGARYLNWMRARQDEHGFIMSDEGDSLLFTGLAGAAGMSVDIRAARSEAGQWFRRPTDNPANSASTISRDMLIGLLWYGWRKRDLELLEDLWAYGKTHHWVMGTGDASRIMLMPPLQGTLALMIAKLGGKKHFQRWNPQLWNKGLVGYEAHLQILHICLMGEIEGQIDGSMWSRISEHAHREPNNPLFTAADARYITGDWDDTELSLSDSVWWPEQRLPTNKDRHEPWLPQRDYGPDWLADLPDVPTKIHTGGDFLFCLSL